MHIGLLQAGHLPDEMQAELGDYDAQYKRLLKDEGLEMTTWPIVDGVFPDSVNDADGWLISGSRHGAYDDLPWIPRLEDFIREIYAAEIPLVGICFGHQITAQALGGKVEKFSGGWNVGRHEYDWNDNKIALNAWHQDQVVQKPHGAEVVARAPNCQYAALLYPGGAFTLQAHPEFDARDMDMLLTHRAPGVVPDPLIEAAKATLSVPTQNEHLGHEIGLFFKEVARARLAD